MVFRKGYVYRVQNIENGWPEHQVMRREKIRAVIQYHVVGGKGEKKTNSRSGGLKKTQ